SWFINPLVVFIKLQITFCGYEFRELAHNFASTHQTENPRGFSEVGENKQLLIAIVSNSFYFLGIKYTPYVSNSTVSPTFSRSSNPSFGFSNSIISSFSVLSSRSIILAIIFISIPEAPFSLFFQAPTLPNTRRPFVK